MPELAEVIFRAIGIVVTSNWIAENVVRIIKNERRKWNGRIEKDYKRKIFRK